MTWDGACPNCGQIIDDIWGRSFDYTRSVRCPHCREVLGIVSIGNSLYGLGQVNELTSEVVARYVTKGTT